jgi:hypothetical protein
MERDYWGFDEWSETRINPVLGNAVLEVFPKSQAPIIRSRWIDGKRTDQFEWQTMRWGLPGPPQFGRAPVTNIRNVKSPHWRSVLAIASNLGLAFQIADSETLEGDWRATFRTSLRLAAVTADDVRRAAADYLVERHRTVAVLVRKVGS